MFTKSDWKAMLILFFIAAPVVGLCCFFLSSAVLQLPPRVYKNPAMCNNQVMSPVDTCQTYVNGILSSSVSYQDELDAANQNLGPPFIQLGPIIITIGFVRDVLQGLLIISILFLATLPIHVILTIYQSKSKQIRK